MCNEKKEIEERLRDLDQELERYGHSDGLAYRYIELYERQARLEGLPRAPEPYYSTGGLYDPDWGDD